MDLHTDGLLWIRGAFLQAVPRTENSIVVHLSPSEIAGGVLFGLLLSGG